MRSAAGSGSRGTPAGGALAQQLVNASTLGSSSLFSILARQDGAAVFCISTISFLLHYALGARLALERGGALGGNARVVLPRAIQLPVNAPSGQH